MHICWQILVDMWYVYNWTQIKYWIFLYVIVTYLKMTIEQAAKIEKRKLGRDKATIHYSRPYDYMDVLDREDLMKLFFKFGFMQSEFLENIFKEAGI